MEQDGSMLLKFLAAGALMGGLFVFGLTAMFSREVVQEPTCVIESGDSVFNRKKIEVPCSQIKIDPTKAEVE
jgi:hypothetical protein